MTGGGRDKDRSRWQQVSYFQAKEYVEISPAPPLILPGIFCWLDFKRRRRVDEATTSSLSNIVNPHLTAGFVKLFVYDPILLICCNFILKRL
jgi:hypothetical protein